MATTDRRSFLSDFRHFFFRGLGILLPSVLTIWILVAAYNFVDTRIAEPINVGLREIVLRTTPLFPATPEQVQSYKDRMTTDDQAAWDAAGRSNAWVELAVRRRLLEKGWGQYAFPLNFIGLVVAVMLIYIVGALLGSFIGRRLYQTGERLINKVPLIRHVYPSVKQVTDFFFGEGKDKFKFNRVVAVEYPRKGLWSVGLVTGDTMQNIEDAAGVICLTVFVPSSPTPFTGYVITVPRTDTIDLDISIDEALRFAISGGVIVPESQRIHRGDEPEALLPGIAGQAGAAGHPVDADKKAPGPAGDAPPATTQGGS